MKLKWMSDRLYKWLNEQYECVDVPPASYIERPLHEFSIEKSHEQFFLTFALQLMQNETVLNKFPPAVKIMGKIKAELEEFMKEISTTLSYKGIEKGDPFLCYTKLNGQNSN